MVAIGPAAKLAFKYAPVAYEVARKLDRRLRPHVLAYGQARSLDGVVGRWEAAGAVHWVVFPTRDAPPVQAFPPLSEAELASVHERIDRGLLRHHTELAEARIGSTADRATEVPARLMNRLRRASGSK